MVEKLVEKVVEKLVEKVVEKVDHEKHTIREPRDNSKQVNNIIKLYFSFMLALVGPSDFFGRAAYGVMPLQSELRL